MKITTRDKKFLQDLYNVRYLNTGRICKLFPNNKGCMRRLKQLVDNGYIRVIDCFYTGEYVYAVSKKTCNILGLKSYTVAKTDKMYHAVAAADFYFYIKPKGVNNIYLEQQYYYRWNGKKYSFRPDIVLHVDRWYFVEIDLCGRRFESKVKEWEGFYNSGEFRKYFDKYPPVVVVSTNIEKVRGVIEKYSEVGLNYIYKDYESVKGWEYRYKV